MIPIDHKVCSIDDQGRMGYMYPDDVRTLKGFKVSTFRELIAITGTVSLRNRKYDCYFRGQSKDYIDSNNRTIIYPGICRPVLPEVSIQTVTIEERWNNLLRFVKYIAGIQSRERSIEYYFALIQHYELMPTPLIDITQSLRVACSFALNDSDDGYIYMIGLPYAHGSISHFIDQNMVLAKLQHVCPANAERPRYQEGYLVGRLPFTAKKAAGDNLAKRIIAKFSISAADGKFWDDQFIPLSREILFPLTDKYLYWLETIHIKYLQTKG